MCLKSKKLIEELDASTAILCPSPKQPQVAERGKLTAGEPG
jgi:hypothetical protein